MDPTLFNQVARTEYNERVARALQDYDERPSVFQTLAARLRRLFTPEGARRPVSTPEQRTDTAPIHRGSI